MKCAQCGSEKYLNPTPTVDIIIEIDGKVVLIQRENPPFGWALPGGFVDYGESFEVAAMREGKEETGLVIKDLLQFRTYSDPARDKRFHTASTVFTGYAETDPVAGDDAAAVGVFALDDLPPLVFDHKEILDDYKEYLLTGVIRR